MKPAQLILASSSPRRADLLRGLGLAFTVIPSGAPETPHPNEAPRDHARRLAEEKARQVADRHAGPDAVVLGADTVVTLDDRILGKPGGVEEAKAMLHFLSGRDHEVLTGVFLIRADDGRSAATVESTSVRFRTLSDAFIDWYVSTDEPNDKAGAYSIQDRGVLLSERIEGSWSNVVGLPLEALPALFAKVGLDLLSRISHR